MPRQSTKGKLAVLCRYDGCDRRTTAGHGFCWQHDLMSVRQKQPYNGGYSDPEDHDYEDIPPWAEDYQRDVGDR